MCDAPTSKLIRLLLEHVQHDWLDVTEYVRQGGRYSQGVDRGDNAVREVSPSHQVFERQYSRADRGSGHYRRQMNDTRKRLERANRHLAR